MRVRSAVRRPLVRLAVAAVLFSSTTASAVPGAADEQVQRISVSYARDLAELPVDEGFSFTVQIGGVTVTDEDVRAASAVLAVQLVAAAPTSPVVETCPGNGANKAGIVVKLKSFSADAVAWATLSFTTPTGGQGDVVIGGQWPVGSEPVRIALCQKLKL